METKKSPRANLENKKTLFLETGFIIALSLSLLAFEWKVSVEEPSDFITVSEIPTEPELVPITMMNQLPPPPPVVIRPLDILTIVEEIQEVSEDIELSDATNESNNSDTQIDINALSYGTDDTDNEIVLFVPSEDMPVFPGNVQKWIAKNINYPALAADNNIQGKVFIQFVVEKDGSISNVKVVRGVDTSIDKEAVRVISSMPKWKPGKQRGKAVRVSYTMPINFQLNH